MSEFNQRWLNAYGTKKSTGTSLLGIIILAMIMFLLVVLLQAFVVMVIAGAMSESANLDFIPALSYGESILVVLGIGTVGALWRGTNVRSTDNS